MLSQEENELLTKTGPGTPAGELLRRYWQPAALSEEVPEGGAPIPLRLFSENLTLFRDEFGRPGLLGIHCSHRAADLSYGRVEDGGLRCLYHGWLYDVHGNCLDQPGEPVRPPVSRPDSQSGSSEVVIKSFKDKIKHLAYPCVEVGGIIYTYMGPGEPPPLPAYEFIAAPVENRNNAKVISECNWLQGAEGNFDPTHLSFLHQIDTGNTESAQAMNASDRSPTLEVEETAFGVRIYAVRRVPGDRHYVRVTNYLLPNFAAVSGRSDGYQVLWHVPIDDTHHYRYMILFNRNGPLPTDERILRNQEEITPDYRSMRNKSNRYMQDRSTMGHAFSGLGDNFLPHDLFATESAGPIQDRTTEHLGYTDRGIIAVRKRLREAIVGLQEGDRPPGTTPSSIEEQAKELIARSDVMLPQSVDWRGYWQSEAQREIETVKVSR